MLFSSLVLGWGIHWVKIIGPHGNREPMLSCLTKYQGSITDCKIIPQVKDGSPVVFQHLKAPHKVLYTSGWKQLSSQEEGQQRGEKSELGYSLQQQQLSLLAAPSENWGRERFGLQLRRGKHLSNRTGKQACKPNQLQHLSTLLFVHLFLITLQLSLFPPFFLLPSHIPFAFPLLSLPLLLLPEFGGLS